MNSATKRLYSASMCYMAHGKGRCRKTVARSADGNGLYLTVQPTGSRSWIQRIMIHGRRRDLGLGGFPLVSLREARDRAFANRKAAREGGDPLSGKHSHVNVPTFAEAAERVWKDNRPGWRHSGHAQEWMSSLARHVLPYIGGKPVSSVSSAEILETLRRIWHSRPETARRVRQRVSAVMDWAVAMEYRGDNPCGRLGPVLGPQQSVVEHMRALPHGDVAGAIGKMWGPNGAGENRTLARQGPKSARRTSHPHTETARWSEDRWSFRLLSSLSHSMQYCISATRSLR